MPSTNTDLRNAGLKVTLPRLKILEILETSATLHLSAEDIYRALLGSHEDIGLATVYRVLTQFEATGLVTRHHFEGNNAVFELSAGHHHDHIVCLGCGRSRSLPMPASKTGRPQSPRDWGTPSAIIPSFSMDTALHAARARKLLSPARPTRNARTRSHGKPRPTLPTRRQPAYGAGCPFTELTDAANQVSLVQGCAAPPRPHPPHHAMH